MIRAAQRCTPDVERRVVKQLEPIRALDRVVRLALYPTTLMSYSAISHIRVARV